MLFGADGVAGAKQHTAQREVAVVIFGRNRQRRPILLDGLREFSGMLERKPGQKSRAAFGGLQIGRLKECLCRFSWVGVHQHQAEVEMGRRHFRIESDGAGEFSLGLLPALQSGIRVAELKMCVGIIGALCNVFLKRLQGCGEIIPVDGVFRLLEKSRKRIFL